MNALHEYWPNLLSIFLALLVAFTSPGPNFMAVSSRAMENRLAGVGTAIGISLGTAAWALFAATGVTAILKTFQHATLLVGLVGGAYLCWLGFKSLRSAWLTWGTAVVATTVAGDRAVGLGSIRTGLVIQLTNPKTALFWLALTSLAIRPDTPAVVIGALTVGSFVIAAAWHVLLAMAFASGPVRQVYLSYKPAISSVFGLVFVGFGLRVIHGVLG
jgi:threonine efflux protein